MIYSSCGGAGLFVWWCCFVRGGAGLFVWWRCSVCVMGLLCSCGGGALFVWWCCSVRVVGVLCPCGDLGQLPFTDRAHLAVQGPSVKQVPPAPGLFVLVGLCIYFEAPDLGDSQVRFPQRAFYCFLFNFPYCSCFTCIYYSFYLYYTCLLFFITYSVFVYFVYLFFSLEGTLQRGQTPPLLNPPFTKPPLC